MKLKNEEDILNPEFRKMVIEEIMGDENIQRKKEVKRKYDVFKDGTRQIVIDRMSRELGEETAHEIIQRTANISILRKIIDKKGMVYKDGVVRETSDHPNKEGLQRAIDFYVDELNHNTKMKKVNKYLELTKNCSYFVSPYQDFRDPGFFKIKSQVMLPHLYDVIEDAENPELGRVWIFSYFAPKVGGDRSANQNESGIRAARTAQMNFRQGDQMDQALADSPDDLGSNQRHFIWWSTNYHLTCDVKGELVEGLQTEDNLNPINMIPIVNFAKGQDGNFWAIGGNDLIDGSILVNQLLTDLYFISKLQGHGIFYLAGPDVPQSLKIGPSDALIMQKKEGDPDTQIGFVSSNPPLADHMQMIEQQIALLLSTNNLEPGVVQGQLSATSAASGIQELIRKSENIDDINDQREIFRDNEPQIFKIIFAWHNLLLERGVLHRENSELLRIPEDGEFSLKFQTNELFKTDQEKLDIIQKRRELNLDSMIDSLMRDNTDLSREEAEDKLQELFEEKVKVQRMKLMQLVDKNQESGDNEEKQKELDGKEQEEEEEEVSKKDNSK